MAPRHYMAQLDKTKRHAIIMLSTPINHMWDQLICMKVDSVQAASVTPVAILLIDIAGLNEHHLMRYIGCKKILSSCYSISYRSRSAWFC